MVRLAGVAGRRAFVSNGNGAGRKAYFGLLSPARPMNRSAGAESAKLGWNSRVLRRLKDHWLCRYQ